MMHVLHGGTQGLSDFASLDNMLHVYMYRYSKFRRTKCRVVVYIDVCHFLRKL